MLLLVCNHSSKKATHTAYPKPGYSVIYLKTKQKTKNKIKQNRRKKEYGGEHIKKAKWHISTQRTSNVLRAKPFLRR